MSAPPADDYARRLAHEALDVCNARFGLEHSTTCDNVATVIARVRADALEEAAGFVAGHGTALIDRARTADGIRALKEKPPG